MLVGGLADWKSILRINLGGCSKHLLLCFSEQVSGCAYVQNHYLPKKKTGLSSYHAGNLPGHSLFAFCVCLSLASIFIITVISK